MIISISLGLSVDLQRYIIAGGKPGKRASEIFQNETAPLRSFNDNFPNIITNSLGFLYNGKPSMVTGSNGSNLLDQILSFNSESKNWEPQGIHIKHPRTLAAICKDFEVPMNPTHCAPAHCGQIFMK